MVKEIKFKCLYCGKENITTDMIALDDYVACEKCRGLHDIEINDNNEIVVEEF